MQRIIDSIFKKKDVLVFLVLLLFSLYLIIDSNYFHKSKILKLSNNIVNNILKEYSSISEYIKLKEYNTTLTKENIKLKNELQKFKLKKTDLPVFIAEDPLRAVVRGTGIALKNIERYKSVLVK